MYGRCLCAAAASILSLYPAAHAGPMDVVDQSQDVLTYLHGIPYFSPMGQSFVPSLSGLDFVDLGMTDNTTAPSDGTAAVRIREGTISGTILGTSETVFLEDCFNQPQGPGCGIAGGFPETVRFDFSTTVPLTPGETYVLEVLALSSSFGVGNVQSNQYPNGTMILNGVPDPNADLWFREGVVVPEPSTGVLVAVAALGGLVRLRRQRS